MKFTKIIFKDPRLSTSNKNESFPPAFQNAKYLSFLNESKRLATDFITASTATSRCLSFPRWLSPPSHTLTAGNTCTVDFSSQGPCDRIDGTGIVDPAFTIKNHTNIWVNTTYMDALATFFLLLYAIYIVYVVS